ncbi:hypothetical protein IM40_03905 [Candidatus Paracaedimonas acanthamoebae]|nr:hypothetical protein IM40_03905 [Candidatus Paracaedimonas acanthamoebae]
MYLTSHTEACPVVVAIFKFPLASSLFVGIKVSITRASYIIFLTEYIIYLTESKSCSPSSVSLILP